MLNLFIFIKRWFSSIIQKDVGTFTFLVAVLIIHDESLLMDIISWLLRVPYVLFSLLLIMIGIFLGFLDSVGVTVETTLILDFILGFVFVQSWLFVLCRILVSLYNNFMNNKLYEYLVSANFCMLLFFLWFCW